MNHFDSNYLYLRITSAIAKRLGITPEIFKINFRGESLCRYDNSIEEFDLHKIKNKYISAYQYKRSREANWESITLHFHKKNAFDSIAYIHKIIDEFISSPFDLYQAKYNYAEGNEFDFCYYTNDLIFINGIFAEEGSFIGISRVKTALQNNQLTLKEEYGMV